MNEPAAAPIKSKSRTRLIILMVLSFFGAILFKLSFVFLFIGMLPAMVAYMVDHTRHKYIFSTVTALNLAGVFPDMVDIFVQGGTFEVVRSKLSDILVWITMYGAAALGWALVWLSPFIAASLLQGVHRGRIMHLENIQKKLEEEWGPEVTQRPRK